MREVETVLALGHVDGTEVKKETVSRSPSPARGCRLLPVVLAGAVAALLVGSEARALINPNFTPIQLVRQSKLIAVLRLSNPDAKARAVAEIRRTLKGKAQTQTVTLDLGAPGKDREAVTEAVVKMVQALGSAPALLFTGEYQEEGAEGGGGGEPLAEGYVHVGAKWLSLYREEDGSLALGDIDSHMEGTWAGGTDMLLRCVEYVMADPEPDVPVASGTSWDAKVKAGRVAGTVRSAQAVDLVGDGRLSLHVASDAGDRLLVYDPKKKTFEDVTAARGLKARSHVAAWGDFNGDGRLDLASWDGSALSLLNQGTDGSFGPQPVSVGEALKAGCLGVAVVDVGRKARPGLLVSTPAAPLLLIPGNEGAFEAKPLAKNPLPLTDLGRPAPCLAADLDGDGIGDVLQAFDKGSLFYKGQGASRFAEPVRWPLILREDPRQDPHPARPYAGDFDQDGRLDVFIAAEDYCKLYHNRGGGKFDSTLFISGEIAYISKPSARGAQVCDVNNDGRQDLLIWYANIGPQIFFNRGYRSFGHAHVLDLTEQGLLEASMKGQQTGLIADLNGDGAQDMVVVVPDGDVWVFFRSIYLEMALAARAVLPLGGPFAGPLTVTGWAEKRCLGAWNVVAGSSEAFLARIDAGPLELRWQFPGGKPQKKEIILESGPVREVLTPGK